VRVIKQQLHVANSSAGQRTGKNEEDNFPPPTKMLMSRTAKI
jgi:hypothetical protein